MKMGENVDMNFKFFLWKMKSVYTNARTLNGLFALSKIRNGHFKVDKFLDEYSTSATSALQQIALKDKNNKGVTCFDSLYGHHQASYID